MNRRHTRVEKTSYIMLFAFFIFFLLLGAG